MIHVVLTGPGGIKYELTTPDEMQVGPWIKSIVDYHLRLWKTTYGPVAFHLEMTA